MLAKAIISGGGGVPQTWGTLDIIPKREEVFLWENF